MNVKNETRCVREKTIVGNVRREKPKKRWEESVKDDPKKRNLTFGDAKDRDEWRCRCRQLVDPDDLRQGPSLKGQTETSKGYMKCECRLSLILYFSSFNIFFIFIFF